ncbi:MAG: TetR family transcriptional regulator, partial [Lapillicoccus sp.]
MTDRVKDTPGGTRRYHSQRRTAQALQTRRAVLDAARHLFVTKGYAATTVADIAGLAEVSVDTLYSSVGRKPALLRELVETSISGGDQAVPAQQRDYVQLIHQAATAQDKLAIYARALTRIHQRMAPVFLALRDAAATDPQCAALWQDIAGRRASNMLDFAAELRATGQVRADLTDRQVADIIWSMNAAEYWVLLV